MLKDINKNTETEKCTMPSARQRTYKCFDCKYYDVQKGRIRGSANMICNKIKNDPRIIVDLNASNCNDYEYNN